MTSGDGAGPCGTESLDGESRSDPRPTFHYLTEDGGEEQALGGLKHLLRRHAEGGSVDVEEGHRRGRLGGGGQRDAPKLGSEQRRDPRTEKGSRVQEQSTSRTTGSKSCPPGPLKDLCVRTRGRLETRGDPLVSASHIIQAGNDLFIGKDEAYIMNRKKKEKSTLGQEGNVYALDLTVKVPSGVDVDATNARSRRTETVSPQRDEHYGCQSECDSASSV